ncbi:hypothetical protein SC1_01504 [Sphingopyxis sp. C-1]|nr:hypothetical protein SC1_01504 [Sphingopyxis sp. C-1]
MVGEKRMQRVERGWAGSDKGYAGCHVATMIRARRSSADLLWVNANSPPPAASGRRAKKKGPHARTRRGPSTWRED